MTWLCKLSHSLFNFKWVTWRNLEKVNTSRVWKHRMVGPQPPIILPGWKAKKRRSVPPLYSEVQYRDLYLYYLYVFWIHLKTTFFFYWHVTFFSEKKSRTQVKTKKRICLVTILQKSSKYQIITCKLVSYKLLFPNPPISTSLLHCLRLHPHYPRKVCPNVRLFSPSKSLKKSESQNRIQFQKQSVW